MPNYPYRKLGINLDREYRNKLNKNFIDIEGDFRQVRQEFEEVVETVSDKAFDKVVDAARLFWLEPVDTYNDIYSTYPTPEEGSVVMARDTGKIYRWNGSLWLEIQDIDPTAINELDKRLGGEIKESRISKNGTAHPTLLERLNVEKGEIDEQLSESESGHKPEWSIWEEFEQRTVNVKWFGATGDGETDDTDAFDAAFSAGAEVIIPEGVYRMRHFRGRSDQRVVGLGNVRIDLYHAPDTSVVLAGLGSNSEYENIHFNCLESDLEWSRVELANRENIIVKYCTFQGFRHASNFTNAWGIYMDHSKNITLDNCKFEDNSQSDIAIVEGCENIHIISPQGSALHINIEPNSAIPPVRNIVVRNAVIDRLDLLENSSTGICVEGVHFDSCTIKRMNYRGCYATFTNSRIHDVRDAGWGTPTAGALSLNGALLLGRNRIQDPRLLDISNSSPDTFWRVGQSANTAIFTRGNDQRFGKVLVFNPNRINTIAQIISSPISVTPNKVYCVSMLGIGEYLSDAHWIGANLTMEYLDSNNNTLSREVIIFNRAKAGENSEFNEEFAFITTPGATTKVVIRISNTRAVDPDAIATNRIRVASVAFREVFANIAKADKDLDDSRDYALAPPRLLNAGGINSVWQQGDVLYNLNPTIGSFRGWICTQSGNPGIWQGFGLIGNAATLGTLQGIFNQLASPVTNNLEILPDPGLSELELLKLEVSQLKETVVGLTNGIIKAQEELNYLNQEDELVELESGE